MGHPDFGDARGLVDLAVGSVIACAETGGVVVR